MRYRPARSIAAAALAALALSGPLPSALAQDAAVGGIDGINCGHFVTIDHAQLFFEAIFQRTGSDRYGLDVNADGTACEGGEINTLFDMSCALFLEQADAQTLYDIDRGVYGVLDADGDGIACSPQGGGGGNRGGTDTGTVIAPTDPGAGTTTTTTTTTTTIPGFDLPAVEITLPQNFPFGTGPSEIGIEISPDELDALDADCLSFAVIGTMVMGHNCAGGDFIGTLPPGTPPDMRISHTPFFQAGAIFTPVGGGGGGGRNGGAGQSPAIDPNTGLPIQQEAQAAAETGAGKRTRTKQKAADSGDAQATAEAAQPARRERQDRAERVRRIREDVLAGEQRTAGATTDAQKERRAERKARTAERRAARAEAHAATAEQPLSAEAIQRSVDRAVERAFRER